MLSLIDNSCSYRHNKLTNNRLTNNKLVNNRLVNNRLTNFCFEKYSVSLITLLIYSAFTSSYACAQNVTSDFPLSLIAANRSIYIPSANTPCPSALYRDTDSISNYSWRAGVFAYMGFIPENKHSGADILFSFKKNAIGLNYTFNGMSVYHNHKIGFSYNRRFSDNCFSSLSLSYVKYNNIENRRGESLLDLHFYFTYRLSKWDLGFKGSYIVPLYSPNKSIWNKSLLMSLCASYHITEDLCIGATIGKDLRYPIEASAELSYIIIDKILIFGSCGVYPFRCSLGAGYVSKHVDILLSTSYHPPLGASGKISIGWKYR